MSMERIFEKGLLEKELTISSPGIKSWLGLGPGE